jgi:hypothetical protein
LKLAYEPTNETGMKNGTKPGPRLTKKPPLDRTQTAPLPPNNRSRITNGATLLPGVHKQSLWARRFRDLFSLHLADLGGEEHCSEGEKALVRRAACLIVELEQLELRFAQDPDTATVRALDLYQRLTNTLRRLLESLGLQRRARDITPPDPLEYAKSYDRRAEDVEEVVT